MLSLLPLQIYLGILTKSLACSQQAMLALREGLLELNPYLQNEGKEIRKKLQSLSLEELEEELQKQVAEKLFGCLTNIPNFYLELLNFRRKAEDAPVVWTEGSSCLYNHAYENAQQPILFIPSLINRHYILDLEENNSFVKFLANKGMDVYLASWNEPTEAELGFKLRDYIARITKTIDIIYARTGKKIILAGYCMGGLLALASAMEKASQLKSLAFFATPWNFHEKNFVRFLLTEKNLQLTQTIIDNYKKIPAAFIQSIFYYLHSDLVGQKFEIHPLLTDYKDIFFAVENWANDGISMPCNVAKECFIGWVNNNNVAKLRWENNGKIINPANIAHLPAFFSIPKKDRIVPPPCALPLSSFFNNSKIIEPNAGHIGMIVGNSAKKQTWEPFWNWINEI